MAVYFPDSSAIVQLYKDERDSAWMKTLVAAERARAKLAMPVR